MFKIKRYFSPKNLSLVDNIRFVPHFKELKLSWTANALISQGMEKFVDELLPKIRANNPQIVYSFHRTYTTCDPFLVGIYEWERKRKFRCSWKHEGQILSMLEEMSIGGDFRPGRKRRVTTVLPRGQELWNTETMGHDVFKVHSKWKADPPDPNEIKSINHPHYVYKRMLRKRNQI